MLRYTRRVIEGKRKFERASSSLFDEAASAQSLVCTSKFTTLCVSGSGFLYLLPEERTGLQEAFMALIRCSDITGGRFYGAKYWQQQESSTDGANRLCGSKLSTTARAMQSYTETRGGHRCKVDFVATKPQFKPSYRGKVCGCSCRSVLAAVVLTFFGVKKVQSSSTLRLRERLSLIPCMYAQSHRAVVKSSLPEKPRLYPLTG